VCADDPAGFGVLHFLQRDYLSRQLDLAPLDPVTGCGASEADHNALLACLQHAFEIEAPAQTAEGFFTQAVAATPLLTLVATQGCFEAVESLVAAGAPLGALDPAGWTALQHATQLGHTTVALVLVDANGDADLVAKGICQAQQAGHTQTADSIVQRAKDNQLNMHDLGTAVLREQARQEALVRCLDSPDSSGRSKSPTKAQIMARMKAMSALTHVQENADASDQSWLLDERQKEHAQSFLPVLQELGSCTQLGPIASSLMEIIMPKTTTDSNATCPEEEPLAPP